MLCADSRPRETDFITGSNDLEGSAVAFVFFYHGNLSSFYRLGNRAMAASR